MPIRKLKFFFVYKNYVAIGVSLHQERRLKPRQTQNCRQPQKKRKRGRQNRMPKQTESAIMNALKLF